MLLLYCFDFYLFIYFWLCWVFVCCEFAFSSCGEWGLLFAVVLRHLIVVASLIAGHGLQCAGSVLTAVAKA